MALSTVDRFCRKQFRALLGVQLAEALRVGRTAEGVVVRPVRQIVGSMALIGSLFAFGVSSGDAASGIQRLFAAAAVMAAFSVLPDSVEAFGRRRDVIGHLPIGRRTAVASRVAFLSLACAVVLAPFVTPTMALLLVRGGLSAVGLVPILAELFAMAITAIMLWLSTAFALSRLFGVEMVRRAAMLLLTVALLGVTLSGSSGFLGGGAFDVEIAQPWFEAMPSAWFVNWFLPAAPPRAGLEALGALALFAGALTLSVMAHPESAYESAQRGSTRDRDGVTAALLEAGLRRSTRPRPTLALALLISRVAARDPFHRIRGRALLMSVAGVGLLGLWFEGDLISQAACAQLGFLALVDAAAALATCSNSEASDWLRAAPIGARSLVSATLLSLLVRLLPLPMLFLAWAGGRAEGWAAGAVLALGYATTAFLVVSALLAFRPRFPFERPTSVAAGNSGIWLSFPLGLFGLLGFMPVIVFATLAAPWRELLAGGWTGAQVAIGAALGVLAVRRLARSS